MSSNAESIYPQRNLNSGNFNGQNELFEFDRFRLDVSHLMLYENDLPVSLAPKVIETLLALIERGGEMVSKEELMNRLWPDSFVEDANLTQNIYLLRKTLGKGSDGRDLIETFRRRGYRFTGQIKEASPDLLATETENALRASNIVGNKSDDNLQNVYQSLAVLPLINESDDANAEYLCDGITESIINRMSQIATLSVVARHTVFQYKNQTVAPQEIGRKLGVGAILTGRVLQHGERLIVRTELVETIDGWQIWGEQYERPAADVLELQEIIAREISKNLHLKLTSDERKRLTKRHTESSEAYHLFVKGRYYLNKRLTETIEQAAGLFQQAIDVDPTFAAAYVGLADCYPLLSLYGALRPQDAYPKAKAAAEKALKIDDRFTKAYNSLGVVKLFYEWDWTGAEAAFQQAIELNPGYPDAHQRYGMLLTAQARFDEAAAELERAAEFDPLSLITQTIGGYPFYYSRRYDEAARCFSKVIATDENYSMAHFRLGLTFAQQGKYENAIAEIQKAVRISNDRDSIAALGYVHGLAGNVTEAETALAELDEREKGGFVTSYNRALIHAGLGNENVALDWLEKAYSERSYWLIYLKVDPTLDSLRGHPRFIDLQEKVFGSNSDNDQHSTLRAISANDFHVRTKPNTLTAKIVELNAGKENHYLATAAIAVVILLSLAIFVGPDLFDSKTQKSQNQSAASSNLKIIRLTPDINAVASTLTPDGNHLAYSMLEKGKYSLWLKNLATGSTTQILPPVDEGYSSLHFSSDGKTLYYASNRKDAPNDTILRVSLDSGTQQKITSDVINSFALSPDEKQLASINSQGRLLIAQTDGSGERVLATRDAKKAWYAAWGATMSWSPDGGSIALCGGRRDGEGRAKPELIEVSVVDGSERLIPIPDWNYLDDVVWLRDQTGLLVVARETETAPFQIWRVGYPDGAATRITNDSNSYDDVVLSSDERFLVALQRFENLNLWTVPLNNSSRAKQITFGNAASDGNFGLAFTPDGRIIYTSPRDGKVDLWVMNANGSEHEQLTKNAGDYNGRPNVSPDNRFIIFTSTRSGARQIWRMDIDGGNPKQLTDATPSAESPNLSPDGAWIYYTLNEGETASIWKIPSGGGEALAVSRNISAWSPSVSPDGKFIAYQFYDRGAVKPWKVGVLSAETGEPIRTFDTFYFRHPSFRTPDSKSLIYINGESGKTGNLWQLPVDGGKPSQLTSFESGQIYNFAVSPDFKQIAISRGNPSIEAVLITNFLP